MKKMYNDEIVLCGASSYTKKFYLNENFEGLPESIKDELKIMCVLYTEDVGGTLQLVYDEDGNLEFRTEAEEGDLLYDEIGSGLLVNEVRRKRQELFESLSLYYRVFILHEDVGALLDEEE